MKLPERIPFWRRMPPAVFPPIMGLLGLSLSWRRAAETLATTVAVADMLLGAVALLYAFAVVAYARKFTKRPGVLAEDIRVLPGRAGLAAMTLSGMLLAAGLAGITPGLAMGLLVISLALHVVLAVLVARALILGPPEGRAVSPVMHLTFVGFIIAPLAALPLGLTGLAQVCFFATLPVAAVIFALSLRQMLHRDPPAPLRPLLAIHLAPLSLFGTVSLGLGMPGVAVVFGALATVVLAVLAVRARYLTQAGFSPLWGAFTFPLAAYAALMLLLGDRWEGFRVLGILALVAATGIVPVIAVKVMKLWARGVLAVRTNAAVA